MDLENMTDDELDGLRDQIRQEQHSRAQREKTPEIMRSLALSYQSSTGREDGQPWVQPTGAHDAYMQGSEVTHEGTVWESQTDFNVWQPGVSGWRESSGGKDTPPPWRPPTGGHDAYQAGELATFKDAVYKSLIDGNVWSPSDYPDGWEKQ